MVPWSRAALFQASALVIKIAIAEGGCDARDARKVSSPCGGRWPAWRARPVLVRACSAVPAGRGRTPWQRTAPKKARKPAKAIAVSVAAVLPGRRKMSKRGRQSMPMTGPVFFPRLLTGGALFWCAGRSFGRNLLKEGFNCRDPCSYWWPLSEVRVSPQHPTFHELRKLTGTSKPVVSGAAIYLKFLGYSPRGEGTSNRQPCERWKPRSVGASAVALWGRRRYISGKAKFP